MNDPTGSEEYCRSTGKIRILRDNGTIMMPWINLALLLIARPCFSDDGHEMEEFLKREYSLSKPYQGSNTVNTVACPAIIYLHALTATLHIFDQICLCHLLPN